MKVNRFQEEEKWVDAYNNFEKIVKRKTTNFKTKQDKKRDKNFKKRES